MPAQHIACGPFQTQSEKDAVEYLRPRLSAEWILLSNVQHSASPNRPPDDLDIVAIGPSGVVPIEVKHWDSGYLKQNRARVEFEVEKQEMKVRRLAGTLRVSAYLPNRFLLTLGEPGESVREGVKGAQFFGLRGWKDLLNVEAPRIFDKTQIDRLARDLEPRAAVALGRDLRTFGPYTNLELQTPKEERFRRVYRGVHASTRDRVLLFRYDVSALDSKSALKFAQRECDIVRKLQKLDCVPKLHDSFQPAGEYPGEIYFWTLIDPAAPSIESVASKSTVQQWPVIDRIAFAAESARSLDAVHRSEGDKGVNLHRNLSPDSIRRRSNNKPLFTDFLFAQMSGAETIASVWKPVEQMRPFTAPEILTSGLTAASEASDVYSLCASLQVIFEGLSEPEAGSARELLLTGVREKAQRPKLAHLVEALSAMPNTSAPVSDMDSVPARYWDEEMPPRPLNNRRYKVISRLGSGGIGTTFKVVQLARDSDDEVGTFVAKVIENTAAAPVCLKAYDLVRPFTLSTSHLAKLCETGEQATPDQIAALLEWIDGTPLSDISGYLSVYSEENSAIDPDELALRWIEQMCRALGVLHHGRLAHGDISPRNIIIRGTDAVLTDYDTVTPFGRIGCSAGTPDYASPGASIYEPLSGADDFFALCASFFYALFESNPFRYGDALLKERGANWSQVDRTVFPLASQFVERGLSDNPFTSEREALAFVAELRGETTSTPTSRNVVAELWQDNHEPWLSELLRSYPGGKHGNRETRGLDSDYALQTYVPTMLDESLFRRIGERTVSLVVLCGNAGDGKTAFLQHLARRLGMEPHRSEQRIWNERLPDGLHVYANLDGSAAYNDRSASELLDELFQPFLACQSPVDRVHLLAVNSGPLLAWIEQSESPLGDHLEAALEGELVGVPEWLCFVDLNARSLVGGRDEHQNLSTVFLDELVTKMLGPASAWKLCGTCTAQSRCSAWASIQSLRDPVRGDLLKKRLFRALQAVHVRGEVHPTARELRAALTYILFDIHECADLHANPNQDLVQLADRAFDSLSPLRQGEILRELAMLDPALEAHPMIDRVLRRELNGQSLQTARRTAYFNWRDEEIERIGGTRGALGLARGKHLKTFLDVPTMGAAQRDALCRELCLGIARLEELPAVAFEWNTDTVPLRITPRTPTESSFWVTKPLARFSLNPDLPGVREPVERLHNALLLTYRYQDGRRVETLRLSSELFHLLLELRDGYQLSDTLSDDTFAHLSIFTQRLVQEDERLMHCWNPMDENTVFEFAIQTDGGIQKMVLTALGESKHG